MVHVQIHHPNLKRNPTPLSHDRGLSVTGSGYDVNGVEWDCEGAWMGWARDKLKQGCDCDVSACCLVWA